MSCTGMGLQRTSDVEVFKIYCLWQCSSLKQTWMSLGSKDQFIIYSRITINYAKSTDIPYQVLFLFKGSITLNWQYTLLAGDEYRYSWKRQWKFLPWFFFHLFFKQLCVFLPSMRTVQLFCVLFSPCVYGRSSTVTYVIFVTVTKVYTYRCIYTVYYPEAMWKEEFSVLHMIVFGLFYSLFSILFLHWILRLCLM